jgi:hypothetical protein
MTEVLDGYMTARGRVSFIKREGVEVVVESGRIEIRLPFSDYDFGRILKWRGGDGVVEYRKKENE